jgi:hypothetical protein
MRPATVAWLAKVRADAAPPGTVYVVISGPAGTVAVFPKDILDKSDDELLAYIAGRLSEITKPHTDH